MYTHIYTHIHTYICIYIYILVVYYVIYIMLYIYICMYIIDIIYIYIYIYVYASLCRRSIKRHLRPLRGHMFASESPLEAQISQGLGPFPQIETLKTGRIHGETS